jgi:hypothetical protein
MRKNGGNEGNKGIARELFCCTIFYRFLIFKSFALFVFGLNISAGIEQRKAQS